MGTVVVEVLAEAVEADLLPARTRGRRFGRLGLQGPMHALVPPVLLGLARLDALQRDAGLDPADRQTRQSARARSGERCPVVRADGQRQAVALEELLDRHTDRVGPGRDDDTGQKETAVGVADGQRVAAFAVAGAEPALEVDAPHIVGCGDGTEGPPGRGNTTTAPSAGDHQPFRTQQIAHRAGRRPHRLGALSHQHCAQLARTPMGTLPAQSNNRFGQLRRHRPTMTVRRTRALHQALRAVLAIATEPFVARLAADAVVLAKRCHRQLTTQTVRNKNQLLVHTTGLLPRHRPPPGPAITCHPSIRSILLPIYPVCTPFPSAPARPRGTRLAPIPMAATLGRGYHRRRTMRTVRTGAERP